VDSRLNTLQSNLTSYMDSYPSTNSGIPENASLPSDFDASNFFHDLGADLESHLETSFNYGLDRPDASPSTSSHLGAYVDEVGSGSATSSPKVSSVHWNDPMGEKELDSEWVNANGNGNGVPVGQKRKPKLDEIDEEDEMMVSAVEAEPPKKKTKVKKKKP